MACGTTASIPACVSSGAELTPPGAGHVRVKSGPRTVIPQLPLGKRHLMTPCFNSHTAPTPALVLEQISPPRSPTHKKQALSLTSLGEHRSDSDEADVWRRKSGPRDGYKCSRCGKLKRNHMCSQTADDPPANETETMTEKTAAYPWSEEEDSLILSAVARLGSRWQDIAKHVAGRSDNAIRNRWHRLQRMEAEKRQKATGMPILQLGGYKCSKCGQLKRGHVCNTDRTASIEPAKQEPSDCPPPPPPTMPGGMLSMEQLGGVMQEVMLSPNLSLTPAPSNNPSALESKPPAVVPPHPNPASQTTSAQPAPATCNAGATQGSAATTWWPAVPLFYSSKKTGSTCHATAPISTVCTPAVEEEVKLEVKLQGQTVKLDGDGFDAEMVLDINDILEVLNSPNVQRISAIANSLRIP